MKTSRSTIAILCALIIALGGGVALAKMPVHQEEVEEIEEVHAFIDLYGNYLELSEKWVQMVSRKETTACLVIERTVEIYEEKNETASAVPALRKFLSKYGENPTIRNMIHFKIAEIYKETGQANKALEELAAIVNEGQ